MIVALSVAINISTEVEASIDHLEFIAVGAMRPMYAKGKLIGVIGVDLQLSNITNFLHNLSFSKWRSIEAATGFLDPPV